jgi:hypothetical protein
MKFEFWTNFLFEQNSNYEQFHVGTKLEFWRNFEFEQNINFEQILNLNIYEK